MFFISDDGREVAKETPAGAFDSMTDQELVQLQEEEEENVDSPDN